jgi:hypothetical protein
VKPVSVFETLSLMILFATLIVLILRDREKNNRPPTRLAVI